MPFFHQFTALCILYSALCLAQPVASFAAKANSCDLVELKAIADRRLESKTHGEDVARGIAGMPYSEKKLEAAEKEVLTHVPQHSEKALRGIPDEFNSELTRLEALSAHQGAVAAPVHPMASTFSDGTYVGEKRANASLAVLADKFDPPSAGQREAVQRLLSQTNPKVDEVIVAIDRHSGTAYADRLRMAELALPKDPRIKFIDVNKFSGSSHADVIDQIARKNAAHTITAIVPAEEVLSKEFGFVRNANARYAVVTGKDDSEMIMGVASLKAGDRKGLVSSLETQTGGLPNKSKPAALDPAVAHYVEEHNFYGATKPAEEAPTRASDNPFFSAAAKGVPHEHIQGYALDAIIHDTGLPQELRDEAAAKAKWFPKPDGTSEWKSAWSKVAPADRAQAAAEFSLTAFSDAGNDAEFRARILQQLSVSPRSNAHTIEQLLPIAGGLRSANAKELGEAAEAIQKIGDRVGSFPQRFTASRSRTDVTDILKHEPIQSVKALGGGINETLLVTFQNGDKAVFKPRAGEFSYKANLEQYVDYIREVSFNPLAEDFLGNQSAREAGKSPLLVTKSEVAAFAFEGKSYGVGSIQNFKNGYFDVEKISGDPRYAAVWQEVKKQPEWAALTNRIRAIDYIAGNYDRLALDINYRSTPKNFMLKLEGIDFSDPEKAVQQLKGADWSKLQAALIDNGLGRNSVDAEKFNIDGFGHFPLRADIPPDLREAILHFDEAKYRESMKNLLPAFGIEDVIRRVREAQNRIRTGP
jgi:hypothetical protein